MSFVPILLYLTTRTPDFFFLKACIHFAISFDSPAAFVFPEVLRFRPIDCESIQQMEAQWTFNMVPSFPWPASVLGVTTYPPLSPSGVACGVPSDPHIHPPCMAR